MNHRSPGEFRIALAALLLLCLAVSPAAAADWVPPYDRSIVGVEWNASDPSPALRWIDVDGNTITPPDFNTHVVWGNVKKVLLTDDEVVIRDINPRGDTLDLTGASGKVMTEIPKFYVMSENASTGSFRYYRWFISPDPADGFELHPVHTYETPGTYEVTLTAYTLYGEDTTSQTVEVRAPPVATFTQNTIENWNATRVAGGFSTLFTVTIPLLLETVAANIVMLIIVLGTMLTIKLFLRW